MATETRQERTDGKKRKPLTEEQARLRMAALCARSEQCSHEITVKLQRAGMEAGAVQKVLAFLKENRFVDDARYAAAFARDKVRFCGWGAAKVKAALLQKRIDNSAIAEALGALDASDCREAVMRAARAKARNLDLSSQQGRQKLLRHLASRGFSMQDASSAMEALCKGDD